MNEEYLWDKSGEPDPQVQQLQGCGCACKVRRLPFLQW